MKILTPVLASLAAATLCLNAAQTGGTSTTTTTTLTTPPGTLARPGTTITTPSATVVTPAPSETVEGSATVTTPQTITAPPATVTAPSATVTTTPEPTATATTATPPPGHPIAGYVAQEDQWIEAPASLPGAQMMVLHGDINKAGPYTIRLRLPAGYRVPLHWNDNEVNVTVISGALHIGFAPNFDASNSKEIGPLSFATLPARMKHTEWVDTDTIVQVHGLGPWRMHAIYPSATVQATP